MFSVLLLYAQKVLTIVLAVSFFFATAGLALLTLLFLPYKLLVRLLAKLFRPDLDNMVTGSGDVFFTLGTPERPMANICILAILDGTVDVEHACKLAQTRILNYQENGVLFYKKLKQGVTQFMGYPFFRTDENFDLKIHVRPYDYTEGGLALPNKCQVTQQDLEERLPQLLALPWKKNQSHWEILVIENYHKSETDKQKHTMILFRMSHGLADGYSLHKMVFRFMELEEPKFEFKIPFNNDMTLVAKLKLYSAFPFKLFHDMAEHALELLNATSGWACTGEKQMAISAYSSAIPIDDIKAIKNKMGVSYMAVLLAAVCAALGKLVSVTRNEPKFQNIACTIPLPKLHHPCELTNHFCAGALSLPIAQKTSAALVEEIQQNIFNMSKSYAVLGFDMLLQLGSSLPKLLFQLVYRFYSPDVILSVYPVPYETYSWEGSAISEVIVSGATASSSVPFGAAIFLYGVGGMQRVSITVNKTSFPFSSCDGHLQNFHNYVQDEIRSLLKGK